VEIKEVRLMPHDIPDEWDDYDYCYECTGYGDDYYLDENDEWVSRCSDCIHNPYNEDWND
jgi:hypothetical protein